MNKKEMKKFKEDLLSERERITKDLDGLQDDTLSRSSQNPPGHVAGYSDHVADTADEDYARSFNLYLASSKQQLLQEIDEALDKIEAGTYGLCENCGGKIPLRRLRAKHSARYCLKCVQEMEEEGLL